MFDKTRYVIERKLVSSFFRSISPLASLTLRETYGIEDLNGNLLGYVKKQKLRSNFWFEGKGGTRMGEILSFKKGYKVYDDQNSLQATIRMAPTKESKRKLLALILAFMPMIVFITFIVLSLVTSGGALASSLPTNVLIIFLFSCGGLTMFGLFLFVYLALKGKFGKPKWLIEDPEGRQLAEGNDFSLARHLNILTPNGSAIARIRWKRGLPPSYRINISRHDLDPLLILSYTVVMLHRHTEAVSSAASGYR